MRNPFIIVVAILVAGSTAALVANMTWYKMEWVREEIRNKSASSTQPGGADSSSAVVDPPSPDVNADTDVPEEGHILIDGVLEHLANGTAFIVDARKQGDYDEGHLRGALFVPADNIFDHVDNVMASGVLPTDTIIVYCGSNTCEASHRVADTLRRDFGFENVLTYKNGWEEIEASGRFDDYIDIGGTEQ